MGSISRWICRVQMQGCDPTSVLQEASLHHYIKISYFMSKCTSLRSIYILNLTACALLFSPSGIRLMNTNHQYSLLLSCDWSTGLSVCVFLQLCYDRYFETCPACGCFFHWCLWEACFLPRFSLLAFLSPQRSHCPLWCAFKVRA